ncbi:MAG: hypothetical protein H7Z12_03815 [Rhodospirillaceae bacterium]|nr:hypothetical protein [Rhodospirillales bacterium]
MIDVGNRFPGRRGSSPFDEDFFTLGAPVGPDQPNRREDVIKVETILGNTGHHDLARTDGPLGYWGERQEKRLSPGMNKTGSKSTACSIPAAPPSPALSKPPAACSRVSSRRRPTRWMNIMAACIWENPAC